MSPLRASISARSTRCMEKNTECGGGRLAVLHHTREILERVEVHAAYGEAGRGDAQDNAPVFFARHIQCDQHHFAGQERTGSVLGTILTCILPGFVFRMGHTDACIPILSVHRQECKPTPFHGKWASLERQSGNPPVNHRKAFVGTFLFLDIPVSTTKAVQRVIKPLQLRRLKHTADRGRCALLLSFPIPTAK